MVPGEALVPVAVGVPADDGVLLLQERARPLLGQGQSSGEPADAASDHDGVVGAAGPRAVGVGGRPGTGFSSSGVGQAAARMSAAARVVRSRASSRARVGPMLPTGIPRRAPISS